MTDTTTAPTLIERLDAALAADDAATAQHEAQIAYEEEHGDRPHAWQGIDEAHIAAGDAALDVLREVRPVLDALAAFAAMGDASADVATRFTCSEVDALALILARAGHVEEAAGWVSDHAQPNDDSGSDGDVDDDDHTLHHDVWAAYDAEDDYSTGREEADAVALGYVRRVLLGGAS